ncbi:MAG TPA: dihydrolipoamide acetyltransferase family protein [Frankiaceae bacterium]|jgi:pyruvate dehydrogenase E2 component (dihydrolipoamide acetyltransferase)|nr:dihydrolipoamide acetyltransferase family protein [Frankiaceae bacterium]
MALRHFSLPDLGEGLTEADILGWLVKEGDDVTLNQPIVEVETAKAAVEVPSPWAGKVTQLHAPQGQTVAVGSPLITIDVAGAEAAAGAAAQGEAPREAMLVGYGPSPARKGRRPRIAAARGSAALVSSAPADVTVLAKPPVRKLARDLGVDLRSVRGSGPAGSITRDDVGAAGHPATGAKSPANNGVSAHVPGERIALHGVHKAMAEAMTRSAFTAPQASVMLTVDATATMALREVLATRPEFAEVPLSPLALIARAVCVAASRAPLINSSLDDGAGEIVLHEQLNLGFAVATARGLIVPNVKDAASLSLPQLAAALNALITIAREGHTRPADLSGGTLSITNVGVFGVDGGTPILNPGESAIVCLGTIAPRPWVRDGDLAIREVVTLSMSFDHRVIDGQVASQFLADVGAMVTDPRLLLTG